MPPIPEDAVVIADYMLMADFVPATTHGIEVISKGTKYVSASRDFLYDGSTWTFAEHVASLGGFRLVCKWFYKKCRDALFW